MGRERGAEVDGGLDLGLKREGLKSAVNPHRSPLTSSLMIFSAAPSSPSSVRDVLVCHVVDVVREGRDLESYGGGC